ncbi:MAG: signal peptidase complex subunit 2, partial [Proteobacteria bacterium]|nr:signal peptidase complex subunit 2 [Pseudomonadota bacterium]
NNSLWEITAASFFTTRAVDNVFHKIGWEQNHIIIHIRFTLGPVSTWLACLAFHWPKKIIS